MERFHSRRYFTSISTIRLLPVAQFPDQLSHAIRASVISSQLHPNPQTNVPNSDSDSLLVRSPKSIIGLHDLETGRYECLHENLVRVQTSHINDTAQCRKNTRNRFLLLHSSIEFEAMWFSFRRSSIILMVRLHKMLKIHASVSSEFFSVHGKCCYDVRNMSALSATFAPCPFNVNLITKLLRSNTFLSISSVRHLETTLLTSLTLVWVLWPDSLSKSYAFKYVFEFWILILKIAMMKECQGFRYSHLFFSSRVVPE